MIFIDLCDSDYNCENSYLNAIICESERNNQGDIDDRCKNNFAVEKQFSDLLQTTNATADNRATQSKSKAARTARVKKTKESKSCDSEDVANVENSVCPTRGSHLLHETSIIVDKRLVESKLGVLLRDQFVQADEQSSEAKYGFYEHDTAITGLFCWSHREASKGGKGNIFDPNVSILPLVAVVHPMEEFVELILGGNGAGGSLHSNNQEEPFHLLSAHIDNLIKTIEDVDCKNIPDNFRTILVLIDFDKKAAHFQKVSSDVLLKFTTSATYVHHSYEPIDEVNYVSNRMGA